LLAEIEEKGHGGIGRGPALRPNRLSIAHELQPVADSWAAVFGLKVGFPRSRASNYFGLHNVVMPVAAEFLEVLGSRSATTRPAPATSPAGARRRLHGDPWQDADALAHRAPLKPMACG